MGGYRSFWDIFKRKYVHTLVYGSKAMFVWELLHWLKEIRVMVLIWWVGRACGMNIDADAVLYQWLCLQFKATSSLFSHIHTKIEHGETIISEHDVNIFYSMVKHLIGF